MLPESGDEPTALERRICAHLEVLYPQEDHLELTRRLLGHVGLDAKAEAPQRRNLWTQRDAFLITYGNSLYDSARRPLEVLTEFLEEELAGVLSGVHILPFCPYSSDDGFSVVDYTEVRPSVGSWDDIEQLSQSFRLMGDLVINHVSSRSQWFENFLSGEEPGASYFMEARPEDDLSTVVRPRSSPLLTEVDTHRGTRWVWCTFSADQIDLDFRNPVVLEEFVRILGLYLDRGISVFRLDAVAYLWKEIGTTCIHLPQTHEAIKLLRTLVEHRNHDGMIVTETNVPNRENLTYFGNANEAHAIYNFSLPPLVVNTLLTGDCRHLKTWMMSMPPAQAGTAYLNFLASHDGIGLRPAEGLLSPEELSTLVGTLRSFGGHVSMRATGDGEEKPYELNISLFDALIGTAADGEDGLVVERFLCAHAIMFALEGIPAIYIHSLFGTRNDHEGVKETGRARSINRHRWDEAKLRRQLEDSSSIHARVFGGMKKLLEIRRRQPAFHPNATQYTLHLGREIFAFWRQSIQREQSIFALHNVTNREQCVALSDLNLIGIDEWRDLVSGEDYNDINAGIVLAPYQVVWLSNLAL
ncbi:MAG: sugar phosphorylase [Planctomycetota bacterium]